MLYNIAAVPLNIDRQQILLHLLNFVILFAGLYLLLYKPVKAFMKKRREHYEEMEKTATEKNAAADRAKTEYEGKLASAEREIEEKRAAAKKDLDGYEQMRKKAAEEEADAILAEARKKAAEEKRHAVRSARREISALVSSATKKLVLKETAHEAYDQFLSIVEKKNEQQTGEPKKEAPGKEELKK